MTKTIHPSITFDRVRDMVDADDCEGICIRCGEDAYNVEPDARKYVCESCGSAAVYGGEELMLMGAYHEEGTKSDRPDPT